MQRQEQGHIRTGLTLHQGRKPDRRHRALQVIDVALQMHNYFLMFVFVMPVTGTAVVIFVFPPGVVIIIRPAGQSLSPCRIGHNGEDARRWYLYDWYRFRIGGAKINNAKRNQH